MVHRRYDLNLACNPVPVGSTTQKMSGLGMSECVVWCWRGGRIPAITSNDLGALNTKKHTQSRRVTLESNYLWKHAWSRRSTYSQSGRRYSSLSPRSSASRCASELHLVYLSLRLEDTGCPQSMNLTWHHFKTRFRAFSGACLLSSTLLQKGCSRRRARCQTPARLRLSLPSHMHSVLKTKSAKMVLLCLLHLDGWHLRRGGHQVRVIARFSSHQRLTISTQRSKKPCYWREQLRDAHDVRTKGGGSPGHTA